MRNTNQSACIDTKIGNLIVQYEFGTLDAEEIEKYEDHLMECEFCRVEVEQMTETAQLIRGQKRAIREAMMGESKATTLTEPHRADSSKNLRNQINRILDAIGGLFTLPNIYKPALALATVSVLVVLLMRTDSADPSFESYMSFQPLPYPSGQLRDVEDPDMSIAEIEFNAGMKAYIENDFHAASKHLKKAVKADPESWKYWAFLGSSYYLEKKPIHAIEALKRADSLTDLAFKGEINWLLMQSYLLDGDIAKADSILRIMKNANSAYVQKADSLMEIIRSATGGN